MTGPNLHEMQGLGKLKEGLFQTLALLMEGRVALLLKNPRDLLKNEPLQWGRDFCAGMADFLSDPETSPSYQWAYCCQLQKELQPLRSLLLREGDSLAGGALVFTEGYAALRRLLLELLHAYLPRKNKRPASAAPGRLLRAGVGLMQSLLQDMEANLEPGPSWGSTVVKGTAFLRGKGIGEKCFMLPGGRPLHIFSFPYRHAGSPACYLRDIHGILLFNEGEREERGGIKSGGKKEGPDAIYLHEMGHALFAVMVRQQGLSAAGAWPFLLKECLLQAGRRTIHAKGRENLHPPKRLLAENFCHIFTRVMLSEALREGLPPTGLPESSGPGRG